MMPAASEARTRRRMVGTAVGYEVVMLVVMSTSTVLARRRHVSPSRRPPAARNESGSQNTVRWTS
jgi:hypothetical protein